MNPPAPSLTKLPDIVLLHGANGCREEMQPWCEALASQGFRAHAVDLAGHGGSVIPSKLSMTVFTEQVLAQLDKLSLQQPIVFGYSFGGIVALHLARQHPGRVRAVISLAAKYVFDARTVRHFTHLLQVSRLSAMPQRLEHLSRVHQPNDWRDLVSKLHDFFASMADAPPLTAQDLQAVQCPVFVLSGSKDQVVSADETVALASAIPRAQAALFDGIAHPSEAVPALGLAKAIRIWTEQQGFGQNELPNPDASGSRAE
jgi:pimeloyl-ACP methyl ester carboxylesterase